MESNEERLSEVRRLSEATRAQARRVPRWYWPVIALGAAVFIGTYAFQLPGYAGWGPAIWAGFVATMAMAAQRSARVVPRWPFSKGRRLP